LQRADGKPGSLVGLPIHHSEPQGTPDAPRRAGRSPHPPCRARRKARKLLDAAGVAHHDLDYGSYLSGWRRRNALKMWTGWPTFPMVFVKGVLVGGAQDLERLVASGELKALLA